jgi:endonuclease G, mitochondrial
MHFGRIRVPFLWVLIAFTCLTACQRIERRVDEIRDKINNSEQETENPNLLFGNPSNATTNPTNSDNYLLVKRSFVISYNNGRGTANWAAWRTTLNDLGESLPRPGFEPDPSLPWGFTTIKPTDYSGSGYDRGHLVPSADRFGDPESNAETFHMTNIVPQAAALNQYPWEKLESYSRGIVRRGSDAYTIAGLYGNQRQLRGRVTAPTNCWKIIVILPPGGSINDVNGQTRIIAVDMPNSGSIAKDRWQKYRTSVRSIEERTGYDFLSNLPQELQDVLETRVDDQ